MKILIKGLAKSGTTALFFKIKRCMPKKTKSLFEVQKYNKLSKDNKTGVIAKLILNGTKEIDLESFKDFDKKILIVRDPRDILISGLLYFIREKEFFDNKKSIKKYLKLLEKKEKKPSSIPMTKIVEERSELFFKSKRDVTGFLKSFEEFVNNYYKRKDIFIFKYEDLIKENFEELEKYLGFKLNKKIKVPQIYKRVARTKNYDNWKNWFTKKDLEEFEKIKESMEKYGYNNWELNKIQKILPKHCTEYVKKIINEHRKEKNLKLLNFHNKEISIILPSYNYGWCIKETIDSVLNQDYKNWELIIVDDGSKDNSIKIIKKYLQKYPNKIKLFLHPNKENKGIAETYKLGIKNSQGNYLSFIEADDIWYPDYLSSKLKIFKNNPETILVYNDIEIFGSREIIKEKKKWITKRERFPIFNKPFYAFEYLYSFNHPSTFSCFMVKTETLNEIEISDKHQAWLDWWILGQLSFRGKFFFDKKKKTKWRLHKKSYNRTYESNLDLQEAVKKIQKDILNSATNYLNNPHLQNP
jgi:glycosyltransferase involved in cell wall biosynthesis